jgi:hypothetical protein
VADGDAGFRRFIEEGLSGAPVHANGAVLGMVTQRLRGEGQGLAIPAFALAQAWPPLAQPYPGLPAFDAATAHLYFGRGRPFRPGDPPTGRLKQLVEQLEAQRLVGLMGASGSGKSSLAKAGAAPFYEQRGWATIVVRPGLQPLRGLRRDRGRHRGGGAWAGADRHGRSLGRPAGGRPSRGGAGRHEGNGCRGHPDRCRSV